MALREPCPLLVQQLNFYIDDQNIIKSRGRFPKCISLNSDVINLVLFEKNHPITRLIRLNAPSQVKHLGVKPNLNTGIDFIGSIWVLDRFQSKIKKRQLSLRI